MFRKNLFFTVFLFYTGLLYSQQLTFNEIMSSNSVTIADEDGDFPDWIEIYNPGDNAINLAGFALSDDSTNLSKWIFPTVYLNGKQFLLIFASDKDRRLWINDWETIIDWGDSWKYKIGSSEIPVTWVNQGFDDLGWNSGPSGFGYSDGDDSTTVSPALAIYLRKSFQLANPVDIITAVLHIDYDDAFVAYLNGIEIARANIGQPGIPPAYNQQAITDHEAVIYLGGKPEMYN